MQKRPSGLSTFKIIRSLILFVRITPGTATTNKKSRGVLRPCQTSKIAIFAKIVND